MWATVRRYEGVTDPEEAGRRVAEGFVPLISGMPGFVTYYWFDEGDGVMCSASIFDDRSHEEESNEKAADWVRDNLAEVLPNPPAITNGHVVAHA
jgi:hypothetical protein